MNRSLATVSALSVLFAVVVVGAVAGCSAPAPEEDSAESGDALTAGIINDFAVTPNGSKPRVLTVDLLPGYLTPYQVFDGGTPDYSSLKIDVLDTRPQDADNPSLNLKWVESNNKELPQFVDTIAHGVDVGGGGKCRVTTLSLKKIAVGCTWTWR